MNYEEREEREDNPKGEFRRGLRLFTDVNLRVVSLLSEIAENHFDQLLGRSLSRALYPPAGDPLHDLAGGNESENTCDKCGSTEAARAIHAQA